MRHVTFVLLLAGCARHPAPSSRCPDDAVASVNAAGWAVMELAAIDVVDDGHPDRAALLVSQALVDGDTDEADGIGIGLFEGWPDAALGVLVCGKGGWVLADEPTPLEPGARYGFASSDATTAPDGSPLVSLVTWETTFESYSNGYVLGHASEALPVEEPATQVGVVGRLWGLGQNVALMDDRSEPLAASGWFPFEGDRVWTLVQHYVYEGETFHVVPQLRIGREGATGIPSDEPLDAWFLVGTGATPSWCERKDVRCRTFEADPEGVKPGVDWIAGAWADPSSAGVDASGARWLWTGAWDDVALARGPDGLVPLRTLPGVRLTSHAPPPARAVLPPAPRGGEAPLALVPALTGPVDVHAVAPDGRWAATLGYDGRIDVYSAADGVRVLTVPAELFRRRILLAPDGWLVVAGMNRLEVWDVLAGARVADVPIEGTPAIALDGDRLLVGDATGLAWHDLRTGARAASVASFDEAPDDVAAAGGAVAAAWATGVQTWDAAGKAGWAAATPEGSDWESVTLWFEGDELLALRGDAVRRWSPRGVVKADGTDDRPRDAEGRLLRPIAAPQGTLPEAIAFADEARLVAVGGSQLEVWDLDRLTHARIGMPGFAFAVAADARGASVLWTAGEGSILGLQEVSGPILRLGHDTDVDENGWSGSPPGGLIQGAAISPDRRFVAVWHMTYGDDAWLYPAAYLLDAATGAELGRFTTEATVIDAATEQLVIRGVDEAVFSADGATLYTRNADETVSAWDTTTFEERWNRPAAAAAAPFADVVRSPDGRLVVRAVEHGLRVERDGAPGVMLGADESGRWVAWTDDGWFDGATEADRLLFGVRGTDVLALDQIALERNRPDRVLEALGRGDPRLLAHLRARAEARQRRAGATDSDARPVVVLDGVAAAEGGARLTFTASAPAGLAAVQVYVDGVALYDRGRPVSGTSASVEERVPLLAGDNLVEIAAIDGAGRESVRVRVDLAGPPEPRGSLWYLGIGVSDYASDALDLRYARKDAEDLATLLSQAGGFDAVHVRTIVDGAATRAALAEARSFLAEARPEDTFVLFIAGHGVHDDDAARTYYFLTHEADLERLPETAATFEQVEALLSGIAPRRKLWLMDTCESGEADVGPTEPVATPMDLLAARAVKVRVKSGSGGAVVQVHERDRFLYRDVQRRTGAIVVSSSRGGEYSYESDAIRNGQFTEAVMAALTSTEADADGDGWLTPAELRARVAGVVAEATDGKQNPTIDRDNPLQAVALPLVPVTPPE